jgi:hypothetical protein
MNQPPKAEDLFLKLTASGETQQVLPLPLITEARQNCRTPVLSVADALYVLACYNLLNAWVKTDHAKQDLSVKPYKFKAWLSNTIADLIDKQFEGVTIWMDESVTYVRLLGVDFSFHHLGRNATLLQYRCSSRNVPHTWSQFRLQPRAPLVLDWARQMRIEYQFSRSLNVLPPRGAVP